MGTARGSNLTEIRKCKVLEARLDEALGNLVWLKVSLPIAGVGTG